MWYPATIDDHYSSFKGAVGQIMDKINGFIKITRTNIFKNGQTMFAEDSAVLFRVSRQAYGPILT